MSLTERYKNNGLLASSLLNIGRQARYLLNLLNMASHSSVHSKVLSFFKREKRGRAFQADAVINIERNAILLVKR